MLVYLSKYNLFYYSALYKKEKVGTLDVSIFLALTAIVYKVIFSRLFLLLV